MTMHDMIWFSLNRKSMMLCDFRIFSCQISLELSLCVSRGVATHDVYLASLMVVLIVFPFILTRSSNTKSLYGKSVYEELTWRFVSLYIMRWSNTELERVKILAVDIDDYFDPKIIIFDQVFIASFLSFLLEIILGHLVIFLSYFIWYFEEARY